MTPNDYSENTKVAAETEIGGDGAGHPKAPSPKAEASASAAGRIGAEGDLAKRIAELESENASLKAKAQASDPSDSINRLAEALLGAVGKAKTSGPSEQDNVNRTEMFKERTKIDGNSLMEAQATLAVYKNEEKMPISIPKAFQTQFGPALAVTVNGVRVSIPCDGKTYMIDKTHAMHARERLAKVDIQVSSDESQVVEINA
jgi:hypothetical protein